MSVLSNEIYSRKSCVEVTLALEPSRSDQKQEEIDDAFPKRGLFVCIFASGTGNLLCIFETDKTN